MMRLLGLLVLLTGLFCVPLAGAQDLVSAHAVLEDPDGAMSIDDVLGREFTVVSAIPSRGYSDAVRWIRLEVARPDKGSEVVLRIEPPYLDDVRLFERNETVPSGWKIRATGDLYPYGDRDVVSVTLGFVVKVSQPVSTYYLRVRTTSSSRLYVEALESHDAQRKDFRSLFLDALYITTMLLVLVWATQHNLAERQPVLGWFCLYQAVYAVYALALSGYLALIIPFGQARWADSATSVLVCAVAFAFLLFSRALFRLYSPPKLLMRGLDLLLLAFPLQMLAMLAGHARLALQANAVTIAVSLIYFFIVSLTLRQEQVPRRRIVQAVYLAVALVGLLLQLSNIGLLSTAASTPTFAFPLYAHGLIVSVLFVLLLRSRLRILQEQARQAALDLAMTQRTLEIEHGLKEQAVVLARTDYLTGLFNRRHFVELAERELDRAERYQRPLAMLMIDIDHFKSVNDTRGHAIGDLVLQEVARLIRAALRAVDIVGRMGGEEFAAVLVEMDGESAREVAERVRCTVEEASIRVPEGVPVSVTISIGITHLCGRNADLDTLLNEADAAMYSAKESGRNRVVLGG
jgi:diguanylate cyclase (GGDEF)-like protein